MKIAFFDTHPFEKAAFLEQSPRHEITFFETSLNRLTAPLARGFECVCCFVDDELDAESLAVLHGCGVRLVALRSAGFNNVDLETAGRLGIAVARVPAYSPHAVAEYATALLLSLNRKVHRAYARVRDLNFSLEGLTGFDLCGKTVGVIGTGRIGSIFARIMRGFGCTVLAFDTAPSEALVREGAEYLQLDALYARSDVVSLHLPLSPSTRHLIDAAALARMKTGALLVNTGRGALIDSVALIEALKSGHLGGAALDVYEEEEGIFFKDLSDQILKDDVLARLLTLSNVLITSHQAFLTREALAAIASTTLANVTAFESGARPLENEVRAATHLKH